MNSNDIPQTDPAHPDRPSIDRDEANQFDEPSRARVAAAGAATFVVIALIIAGLVWRAGSVDGPGGKSEPVSKVAALTIVQQASPNNGIDFIYRGGVGRFELDNPTVDDDDLISNRATFVVVPRSIRIRQQPFGAWNLDSIRCTGVDVEPDVDLDERVVVVDVQPDGDVTCTFTNSRSGADDDQADGDGGRTDRRRSVQ